MLQKFVQPKHPRSWDPGGDPVILVIHKLGDLSYLIYLGLIFFAGDDFLVCCEHEV